MTEPFGAFRHVLSLHPTTALRLGGSCLESGRIPYWCVHRLSFDCVIVSLSLNDR